MKSRLTVLLLCGLTVVVLAAPGLRSGEGKPRPAAGPQYNDKGELKRPTGYRTWVFVGANLGLGYRKDVPETTRREKERHQGAKAGDFHNVYIDPPAYEHYVRTGKFPDGTVLVMDVYESRQKEPQNIVSKGFFPGDQVRIEVAVKNSKRPDGSKTDWAYYVFPTGQPAAKAFPDADCYQCHRKHADDDNVWVQFYPTLRPHKKPGGK